MTDSQPVKKGVAKGGLFGKIEMVMRDDEKRSGTAAGGRIRYNIMCKKEKRGSL